MPADLTWSLSGVDARRWRILSASSGRAPVSMRSTRLVVPGRHGSIAPGLPVFDEPTVTLVVQLLGDQAALEGAQAELLGLLSAPGLAVSRSSGGVTASAPARLEKVEPQVFVADVLARLAVTLSIPGVFLRGDVATSPAVALSSSPQAVELGATLAGSNAPIGDAVVRVTGPASSVSMVDEVTGTGLSWTGTALTAGRYLYLDAARMTARWSTSATAWTSGGTDVTSGLDYPPAGRLQVWPRMHAGDPADRRATLTVTGGGYDTDTALVVRAAPAYL